MVSAAQTEYFLNEAAQCVTQTPFMLTDLRVIRDRCKDFRVLFPGIRLQYAIKAFSDAEVITAVDEYVDGFDAASIKEVELLLSLGISPDRIAFNNPVKPIYAIKAAYAYGIRDFTFQSRDEVNKIAENAPGSRVLIRIKMDDSHSEVPLSTKYGCSPEAVVPLMYLAKENGLVPAGITFHVGSQQTSGRVWSRDISMAKAILKEANAAGIRAQIINIGGGLPVRYAASDPSIENIAKIINGSIAGSGMQYIAEPGRFVVADSSAIVATIISKEERGGQEWLFLDTGLFQAFLGAVRYASFPYSPIPVRNMRTNAPTKRYVLTGPSCDSQDIIAQDIVLPDDLRPGDKLLFPMTGAYTVVYGSSFNGFDPPKRIFLN